MRTLTWFAFPFILTACLEEEEPSVPARVFFVSPANGDTIGTDVRIDFGAIGFRVKPAGAAEEGSGFLTLFIDEPCVAEGELIRPTGTRLLRTGGETFVELSLDPGPHRLCLQASDGRGIATALTSTIEVEVVETRVQIVSPSWGAATGRKVKFELASQGIIIEPSGEARLGAGHYYLVIDEECPPEAFPISLADGVINLPAGESSVEVELSPGPHEIWVGLADGEDIALAPRTRVQIYAY